MEELYILSEYQSRGRNAKVYTQEDDNFGVITFDADTDYNGYQFFVYEREAEEYAREWVLLTGDE